MAEKRIALIRKHLRYSFWRENRVVERNGMLSTVERERKRERERERERELFKTNTQ